MLMFFLDWVSIATLSTEKVIKGYPFVNLKSMSDGPTSNGTGIPYLYMSDLDQTGQDIKVCIFKFNLIKIRGITHENQNNN